MRRCEKISHVRRSFICRSIYTSFFMKNPSLRRSREKNILYVFFWGGGTYLVLFLARGFYGFLWLPVFVFRFFHMLRLVVVALFLHFSSSLPRRLTLDMWTPVCWCFRRSFQLTPLLVSALSLRSSSQGMP